MAPSRRQKKTPSRHLAHFLEARIPAWTWWSAWSCVPWPWSDAAWRQGTHGQEHVWLHSTQLLAGFSWPPSYQSDGSMLGMKHVDQIIWVWLKILNLTHPFPMAFNLFDGDCELWPFKLLNINLPNSTFQAGLNRNMLELNQCNTGLFRYDVVPIDRN